MIQSNGQVHSEGEKSDRILSVHIVEIFEFIDCEVSCPQATDSIVE